MINNLDEFTAFLKICRKQGVTQVTLSGVSVTLGELPKKRTAEVEAEETDEPVGITDEQLMLWSVGGANQ